MYLIKLQYSVLGILNIYICLTHWPLEVLLKTSFEASETAFWLLSGYKQPKLPRMLFIV